MLGSISHRREYGFHVPIRDSINLINKRTTMFDKRLHLTNTIKSKKWLTSQRNRTFTKVNVSYICYILHTYYILHGKFKPEI